MTGLYSLPQSHPPHPARDTLPTMYDLPSEALGEPGLPDEYHDLQPQLLSRTFRPPRYSRDEIFTVGDMNLYCDVRYPRWYKRPDWFAVVGVPRLYDEIDMRLSYVIWQEGVTPIVVVELLSPGTEADDLGRFADGATTGSPSNLQEINTPETPPPKWEVYERILRVPYYVVFSRYTNQIRVFVQTGSHYQEQVLTESRVWFPDLELGLGLWTGEFEGIFRQWLRWFDREGNWIATDTEQAQSRAEQAEEQLAALREQLRRRGIDPDSL